MGYGVALEAQVGCPECAHSVFVGALVEQVRCVACGHTVVIEANHWQTLLATSLDEAATWPLLGARKGTVAIGSATVSAYRIRQDPTFRETKTPIELAAAKDALARGWVDNPDGTRPATVRVLPPSYQEWLPNVLWLAEEDPGLLVAAGTLRDVPPLPEPKGLSTSCVQCGSPIELREAGRLVTCGHCRHVAFLADEIWNRLHPDARPHRFYLWVDGTPNPRAPQTDAKRHDPHDQRHLASARPFDAEAAYWIKVRAQHRCRDCDATLHLPALAPAFACPRCHAQLDVPTSDWARYLGGMARTSEHHAGTEQEEDDPGMLALERAATAVTRYVRRAPPQPEGSELEPARALATADGQTIGGLLVRHVPQHYRAWLPGIERLVGEAPYAVAGQAEPSHVPGSAQTGVNFGCPSCGGALAPDGLHRMIECSYCARGVGIPDDVWQKLHPPQGAHWFYLLYDPGQRLITFDSIDAVAPAPDGGLYVIGDAEDGPDRRLWALDPSQRRRFAVELPSGAASRACVAAAPDGDALVWHKAGRATEVHRFARDDGSLLQSTNVGEGEFFAIDDKGRMLGLTRREDPMHFIAVRVDLASGKTTPIWPEATGVGAKVLGFLKGVLDVGDVPTFARLGSRPTRLDEHDIEVIPGPGERITLRLGQQIATWTGDGSEPIRAVLPCLPEAPVVVGTEHRLVFPDPEVGRVQAVTPDGDARSLADTQTAGESLFFHPRDRVAVYPDGTFTVAGTDGALQCFAADGTRTFTNWRARARAPR